MLNLVIDRQEPGGGVLESQLVDDLYDALELQELPHLINMSAGCPTRLEPSSAVPSCTGGPTLEHRHHDPDLVLVAAAGNNSSPWRFWPASFDWAVGVGSLDSDGRVSEFSNWGDSVDVFALGRNVVNAFPNGTYVCHECPDRGDKRIFDDWLARWSGTSFSAPLVTGLIAAAMSRQPAACGARAPPGTQVLGVAQMRSFRERGQSARAARRSLPCRQLPRPGHQHDPRRTSQHAVDPYAEPHRAGRHDHREDPGRVDRGCVASRRRRTRRRPRRRRVEHLPEDPVAVELDFERQSVALEPERAHVERAADGGVGELERVVGQGQQLLVDGAPRERGPAPPRGGDRVRRPPVPWHGPALP